MERVPLIFIVHSLGGWVLQEVSGPILPGRYHLTF